MMRRWPLVLLSTICGGLLIWALSNPVGQKLLGRLAMPVGLLWLGLLAATLWALWHRSWMRGMLLMGAWLLLTVAGNSALGDYLMTRLERAHPPQDLRTAGPFDAVFVCGGGTSIRPDGQPSLGSSGDRLLVAVTLWKFGRTPHLVASGASVPGLGTARSLAAETQTIWRIWGIPDTVVLTLTEPINTSQEIAAYRALANANGWQHTAVISSAWHLPRISNLCSAADFHPTLIGADYQAGAVSWSWISVVPSLSGLNGVQVGCWEILGRAVGR